MKTLFDQVYKENYSQIFNYVLNKVNHDDMIAEEITNDTFLRVNEHLTIFNPDLATISTWIHTIAKRIVIDYYRKNKGVTVSIDTIDDEGKELYQIRSTEATDKNVESKELAIAINTAMDKLTGKYKDVADLYFLQNKKYTEIAEILDIPLNSVKVTLLRAKEALQWYLRNVYKSVVSV